MNKGCEYQQHQHQGVGNYNQYNDNTSVGKLLGRQIYATITILPLPRGPAIVPPENKNRSAQSDSVDQDQCSTHSTSSQQAVNILGRC